MTNPNLDENGLLPIDPRQCQALKPNGFSIMTLGGRPGHVRCEEKPKWVGMHLDKKSGKATGMSLCDPCKEVMDKQLGTKETLSFQRLARERA